MDEPRTQRRLAAVLATDVVGYSRLMEEDEAGTMSTLKARQKEVLQPAVRRHEGRIFKLAGDGALVEFGSAVNAVECAIDLQQAMAEANRALPNDRHVILRVGINLGDVIVEGSDLYGDGVNVAARLEGLAEPGGICVSRSVYDQVKRKVDVDFEELGPKPVKNISEPVHVYAVRSRAGAPERDTAGPDRPPLPLPAKPSIAVLPFTNVSNDPEQEPFADGMTEDLITDLSRNAGLFVIARNSTFAYKGKSVDVRRIAQDLGVRYLLEGSARRAAGRVRINVQLIDAAVGSHIWAERFDRGLEDIFAVQDEVTGNIVEALVGRLSAPPRKRPKSLKAYDICVRARILNEQSPLSSREAYLLLKRAIALDPFYAEAHSLLATNRWIAWVHFGEPEQPSRSHAMELAEKAVALDPDDARSRSVLGLVLAYDRRFAEAEAAFKAALDLDPNDADTWANLSDMSTFTFSAISQVSPITTPVP
jgi:TolB-like protein